MTPALWYPCGRLNSAQQFLHTINGKVILSNSWIPVMQWQHDQCIMEDVQLLLPVTNHIVINNVRLFLWVTMLSEITNASKGTNLQVNLF